MIKIHLEEAYTPREFAAKRYDIVLTNSKRKRWYYPRDAKDSYGRVFHDAASVAGNLAEFLGADYVGLKETQ